MTSSVCITARFKAHIFKLDGRWWIKVPTMTGYLRLSCDSFEHALQRYDLAVRTGCADNVPGITQR
jgi:hypothetical protein